MKLQSYIICMGAQPIVMVIVQRHGELYVHQRSEHKPPHEHPLEYGLGAGGKVDEGESPLVAAARELFEELEIDADLEQLFDFPFPQENKHVYVCRAWWYRGISPKTPEFKWSGWMSREEIDALAAKGELMPDTKVAYEKFKQEYWSD